MKSRRQKILCVLAICFLCASFFISSVSAEDIYRKEVHWHREWEWNPAYFRVSSQALDHDDVFYFTDNTDFDLLPGPTSSDMLYDDVLDTYYVYFDFKAPERSNGFFIASYYVNHILGDDFFEETGKYPFQSDGFYLDPGILNIFLSNPSLYQYQCDISHLRFSLRYYDSENMKVGTVYAATDLVPVDLTLSGSSYASDEVVYDSLVFKNRGGAPSPELALCIDYVGTVDTFSKDITLGLYSPRFYFNASIGGIGPQVPQYTPPDFRPEDDLHELESDVIGSISPNLDVLDELNNDFGSNLQSFSLVFARISQMLTRLTGGIPFMDVLFQFSLILGFWAFAVGSAGAIIGAAGRSSDSHGSSKDKSSDSLSGFDEEILHWRPKFKK